MNNMTTVMKDIVNWLKQWYYTEDEIDTKLSNKANKNLGTANYNVVTDSSGDITVEAKPVIPSDVSDLTDTNDTAFTPKAHNQASSTITESSALTHIGTTANATQHTINVAIDGIIDTLSSIRAINIVDTLPTASSSTMGKLYIVSENSKVNVYYTKQTGSSYDWVKMDTDILDEFTVNWTDVNGRPSKTSDFTNDGSSSSDSLVYVETSATSGLIKNDGTIDTNSYSTTSHSHNQITSDGKITSSAVTVASGDNIVITDASDSSKIKRVANLLASHIKDSNAHTNIGSSANATQQTINTSIDTALGNKISTSATSGLVKNDGTIDTNTYLTSHQDISGKADKTGALGTTITLVDKGETNEGCIIFNTIS